MSLFPRFQEFSPIFRLIDDYERATRQNNFRGLESNLRSFSPKFDVKELKDSYELHGELPGIEQKDVNIEWTDGNTLTVSGRTEHRSERGTPPQGFIEEGSENKEGHHEYHKPTVEDEGEGSRKQTAVAKTDSSKDVAQQSEDGPKYWVTERSVGEFHRSFSFPTRVDQDGVKASLKNGILSIVVPKAQAPKPRKINIE
ncbi:HSP20-like chaperone [Glonium stellatum]|uniref:HSP20-like chaperone n=1 Tax=Glonium stellatum TaxID=574774 RepID=A0A8E2F281_9PEZI|nr:HSP20-like chaperone [Glonium stellatum]